MITHIIFLQPKPTSPHHTVLDTLHQFEMLQEAVPEVIQIQSMKNVHSISATTPVFPNPFSYSLIAQFSNEEHLQAFHRHEAVREVVQKLEQYCEKMVNITLSDTVFPSDYSMPKTLFVDERIKQVIIDVLKVDRSRIIFEASLSHDLHAMSWGLDHAEMGERLGEIFNITISLEDACTWETVGDIQAYLLNEGVL